MIILTGHEGFIGSHFLNALKAQHKEVVCVEKEESLTFLDQFDSWNQVTQIIHMGANSSTVGKDVSDYYKYNIDFSIRLFEKAIQYQIPVKYASSASVYGLQGYASENRYNPLNYYALSKLTVDYWVLDNIERFKEVHGYRFFNVYGSGEDKKILDNQSSPISKFIKQIEEQGYIQLFEGSESFHRDFVWVADCVDIVLYEEVPSGIYDVGTSRPVSFQYVAEKVVETYGGEIRYVAFPEHLIGKYQEFTCAQEHFPGYNYLSVAEYLNPDEGLVHSSEGC
jgi:ADP-L-glycero-D-manno-heptose 6-epimerase